MPKLLALGWLFCCAHARLEMSVARRKEPTYTQRARLARKAAREAKVAAHYELINNKRALRSGSPDAAANGPPPLDQSDKRQLLAVVPMLSCYEVTYTCEIALGTPPQRTSVVLDTGSSDLWLLRTAYDHKASATFAPVDGEFEISYADGTELKGRLGSDTVTWGGLAVPKQVFAEVKDDGSYLDACGEEGLMGLAFDAGSNSRAASPFHNLVTMGVLEAPIFSFLLIDDKGGLLTVGGVDPSHYQGDTLSWFPVVGSGNDDAPYDDDDDEWDLGEWQDDTYAAGRLRKWEVRLKSVSIADGSSMSSSSSSSEQLVTHATALLDTGTTYLILPRGDFATVTTALGATCWFTHDGEGAHRDEAAFVAMKCEAVQADSFEGSGYHLSYVMGPCSGAAGLGLTFGSGSPSDKAAHEASATLAAAGSSPTGTSHESSSSKVTFAQQATFDFNSEDLAWSLDECAENEFRDCLGGCYSEEYRSWVGDGQCDDGSQGFSFNCAAFECDGGDCHGDSGTHAACLWGDPGNVCELGLDVGTATRDHWTLGDVFLRKVFTAYDYAKGAVGMAYGNPHPGATLGGVSEPEENKDDDDETFEDDDFEDDDFFDPSGAADDGNVGSGTSLEAASKESMKHKAAPIETFNGDLGGSRAQSPSSSTARLPSIDEEDVVDRGFAKEEHSSKGSRKYKPAPIETFNGDLKGLRDDQKSKNFGGTKSGSQLPTIEESLNEVDDNRGVTNGYTKKRTFVSGSNNGAFVSNDLDVFDIEYRSEKEDSKVHKASASSNADSSANPQSHEAVQNDAFLKRLRQKQSIPKKAPQQAQQPLPDLRDGLLLYFAAASLLLAGFCMQSSSNNEKSEINVTSRKAGGMMSAARTSDKSIGNYGDFNRVCSDENEAETSSAATNGPTAQDISDAEDDENRFDGNDEEAAANSAAAAGPVLRGACVGLGTSLYFLMWASESAVEGSGFAVEWASGAFAAAAAAHACGLRASLPTTHEPRMGASGSAAIARRSEGQAAAEWETSRQRFLARIYELCVLPAHAAVAAWHLAALRHLQKGGAATQIELLYCICAASLWLICGGVARYSASVWREKEELYAIKTGI